MLYGQWISHERSCSMSQNAWTKLCSSFIGGNGNLTTYKKNISYLAEWVFLLPWVLWVRWQHQRYHRTWQTAVACRPSETICRFRPRRCQHNTFSYPRNYWWQRCSCLRTWDYRPDADLCTRWGSRSWHYTLDPSNAGPCRSLGHIQKRPLRREAFYYTRTLGSNHSTIIYNLVLKMQSPTVSDMLKLIH